MARARSAKKPHEARLLRLAAWILEQAEPVTRGRIYEAFPDDYGGKPDAAERKFSRDKDALKRLGFNLETEELGGREDPVGYAIDARTSMLPPIDLGVEEAAAVWTAGIGALRLSPGSAAGASASPTGASRPERSSSVRLPKDEADARARRGRKGDYDVPDTFDIRRWSRQEVWDYNVHPPIAAAVRFRGSLAGIAKQLLPTALVTTDESGARVARVAVRNLRGLVRQALAWGPDAEVVEPAEARAVAREFLASVVDRSWEIA